LDNSGWCWLSENDQNIKDFIIVFFNINLAGRVRLMRLFVFCPFSKILKKFISIQWHSFKSMLHTFADFVEFFKF
jgi:hypothetical protein